MKCSPENLPVVSSAYYLIRKDLTRDFDSKFDSEMSAINNEQAECYLTIHKPFLIINVH